jgi:hypothetical protein
MGGLIRRGAVTLVAGIAGLVMVWSSAPRAQGEPPGRVGRLAFTDGAVSLHDSEQSQWTPAAVNTPLSSGDSLWTEPNARSEISLAGTRIRMAGATQLDMLAVDDTQTRLQLDQGRIDLKTQAMDASQPYQITTPRGTISLLQPGDYYVEAGSTEDPTQIGVRAGAAQIEGLNGQLLAVRPGEVGEVTGDAATPQLRTIHSAPPPPAAAWADRDRQVSYDQPPQYLTAGVTGYEDLNQYGTWVDDSSYGEVWIPRSVPAGWAPYRTGHWVYEQPWGWTWIDDQPWGFAPYHYGRWANRDGRWMWLPPQRDVRPVYAPALVAFVGGVELSAMLSRQSSAPVGWFPLGPREAYVPPYTTNRDYYQRINRPARVEDPVLAERWQSAQRQGPAASAQNQPHAAWMNQRFATVVPATAFVHSQPVARAALQVAPDRIAAAPVAPVAAPPAPAASVGAPNAAKPPATPAPATNLATAKTAVADMPTFARPAALQAPAAPGPKFAATRPTAPATDKSQQALPALAPRQGVAPPELKGAVTPAPSPSARPGEPPRQQQPAPQPHAAPAVEPNHPPAPAPQPPAQHHEPPQANQPQHPVEPPRQQAVPQPQPQPQHQPTPQEQGRVAPPPPQPHPAPQPQPQHQPAPQEGHAAPPPQPHPAPPPQQAQAPHPAPPPPQQQAHPAPPTPAPAPAPQQHKEEEKK